MDNFSHSKIEVQGKEFDFFKIQLPKAPILLLRGEKGFIMCGYLDVPAAESLGDVAAKVKGVNSIEDFLQAQIVEVTSGAEKVGIKPSMKAKEAILLLS